MSNEREHETVTLNMLDLALEAEGKPYVLIQAKSDPDDPDGLLLAVRSGNGAQEMIGAMPLMALAELDEEHNPAIAEFREVYDSSDESGRAAVRRLAQALGFKLGGGHDAD